jgi:hypothetical protein
VLRIMDLMRGLLLAREAAESAAVAAATSSASTTTTTSTSTSTDSGGGGSLSSVPQRPPAPPPPLPPRRGETLLRSRSGLVLDEDGDEVEDTATAATAAATKASGGSRSDCKEAIDSTERVRRWLWSKPDLKEFHRCDLKMVGVDEKSHVYCCGPGGGDKLVLCEEEVDDDDGQPRIRAQRVLYWTAHRKTETDIVVVQSHPEIEYEFHAWGQCDEVPARHLFGVLSEVPEGWSNDNAAATMERLQFSPDMSWQWAGMTVCVGSRPGCMVSYAIFRGDDGELISAFDDPQCLYQPGDETTRAFLDTHGSLVLEHLGDVSSIVVMRCVGVRPLAHPSIAATSNPARTSPR